MAISIGGALRRTALAQRVEAKALASWRRTELPKSPYFDATWYLENNEDVRLAGADPLDHFLGHGESENRNPGPMFDSASYIASHPDAHGAALTHLHRTIRKQRTVTQRLPAIKSQWFNEAWYRHAHSSLEDTDFETEHPIAHYDRTGLDPSPLFDVTDYQSQLNAAGIAGDPLDHWLAANTAQISPSIRPRVLGGTPASPPAQPVVQHRVRARCELADLDIVVMIHAYYLDVLPSLLRRLPLLPATPMLLVSVMTQADASDAHRTIDHLLGRDQPRVIKIVPNRGRNFAPLFCSFADEIPDHDYVLHLHTKKSLHMGHEQSEWRAHLVRSLLPSTSGVDAILSLLADDATVGVVQPPTWTPISHYAHYWFGTAGPGAGLYDRLGVTERPAHGYVMYPVGGMFWAKVDAVQPLLELGLTVGDFDREHGQNDGTLAHAIERTIPAAAAVAGFDTIEVDASAAQWRRNWSPKHHPEFGPTHLSALHTALESADLVTVSLFGTLVLGSTGDLRPRAWLINGLQESRSTVAPPGRTPQRFVLMADTTQSLADVEALLAQIGARDLFDDLYISNLRQARKDTGSMWDQVRTGESPEPGRWLHIGDDEVNDVERSIERGIIPFHVPAHSAEAQDLT